MDRRTVVLVGILSVAIAAPAAAQSAPAKVHVFGGYSLLPANGDDFPRQTSHGFQGGVSVNITRTFAIVGDVGVQFSRATDLGPNFAGQVAKTQVTEYLAGPRFVGRGKRVDVFGHGLFGWAAGDAGDNFSGFSDSNFCFGGGGGVDVHVTPRVAVRGQFDLIGSFTDILEGNSRFAAGLVLSLGR